MKRKTVMCILYLMPFFVLGQSETQFTQYMSNMTYINPSFSGQESVPNLTLHSRLQWAGYESNTKGSNGAPVSHYLNYDSRLQIRTVQLGSGLSFMYDQIGEVQTVDLRTFLAYHLQTDRGVFSVGASPRLIAKSVQGDVFDLVDPEDPLVPNVSANQSKFDLDVGGNFIGNDFSLALGVNHLLMPVFNFGINSTSGGVVSYSRSFSVFGEYNYRLGSQLTVVPSVLMRTNLTTYNFSISSLIYYEDQLWAGLSYRGGESVSFLFGYSFMNDNDIKIGYSFDFVVEDRESKSATSHEVYVNYRLPSMDRKSKKVIRTPRFRF